MPFDTPQKHNVTQLQAAARRLEALEALDALLSAKKRRPLTDVLAALPDGMTSADLVIRGGRLTAQALSAATQRQLTQLRALRSAHRSLRLGSLSLLPVRANTAVTLFGAEAEFDGEGDYVQSLDSEVILVGVGGAILSLVVQGKVEVWIDRQGQMRLRQGEATLLCNGDPLMSDPDDEYRHTEPVWDGALPDEVLADFGETLTRVLGKSVTSSRAEAFIVALMPALVPTPTPHCS